MIPRLRREEALLWICDVQTRLLPEMWEAQRIEKNTALLGRVARLLGLPVVVTEQNPEKLGSTCDAVREALGDFDVVAKMSFDGFTPQSQAQLENSGRRSVILCGLESHICVAQTALSLRDGGHQVFAVADAISSRQEPNRRIGWERMRGAGCLPSSTEAAIYELLERAGTDEFRALLSWIK